MDATFDQHPDGAEDTEDTEVVVTVHLRENPNLCLMD